jgi:hypothetical protein
MVGPVWGNRAFASARKFFVTVWIISLQDSKGLLIITNVFHFNPHLPESSFRNCQSDSNQTARPLPNPKLPCHVLMNASLHSFVRVCLYRHSAPSCCVMVVYMFILIYILFFKVVSYFQVFESKFCTSYFFIDPTWPAIPPWFVAQDYKFISPSSICLHVCFTKCLKTTFYWEKASTCANIGKQRVLGRPSVTYLHFYACFNQHEYTSWNNLLISCCHLRTLTNGTNSIE